MKKLLICMVVALLAIVLVACGGENITTTQGKTTTSPTATTTNPKDNGNTNPGETSKPADSSTTPDQTNKPADSSTTPDRTNKPADSSSTPDTDTPENPGTPEGENLFDIASIGAISIETHHASLDNEPALVFYVLNNEALYLELRGNNYPDVDHWSNPKYTWKMTVNGEEYLPTKFSIYNADTWGYFRAALGAESNYDYQDGKFTFNIQLQIVNTETGKVAYYADFGEIVSKLPGFEFDESKPDSVSAVPVSDITPVSGPGAGGGEGYEKAFDGKYDTKVCTGDNGAENAIVVKLNEKKTLKGISICNASDNESYPTRTVISFEILVSNDNETWTSVYTATGEGLNKNDLCGNYIERYFGFENAVEATYVKIIINNGEMYQLSEIFLYV